MVSSFSAGTMITEGDSRQAEKSNGRLLEPQTDKSLPKAQRHSSIGVVGGATRCLVACS